MLDSTKVFCHVRSRVGVFAFLLVVMMLSSIHARAQSWVTGLSETDHLPKREVRAVWLATIGGIDWPRVKATDAASIERQKRELTNMLDRLQLANINTVLLQTRVRGTVIYPSEIEPWDDCLTGRFGRNPGYDPLQFAIEECHKRGMELHAWLVCIPLGTAQKQKAYGTQSITRRHPSLCQTAARGEMFMKPSDPATADYIAALCREIVTRYDVDGISLDYIRYPEAIYQFRDASSAAQKRENINRIVRRVHEEVKAVSPWVKLSSSPIGKYNDLSRYSSRGWNCFSAVYQDPKLWLQEGWQDLLFPMMYFLGDHFYPFLYDWKELACGRPVIPGLGIYFLDPREGRWSLEDVCAQMHAARNSGIGGIAFYRSEFLTRNHKGLYSAVVNEFFSRPALTLPLPSDLVPTAVSDVVYRDGILSWKASEDDRDVNGRSSVVYHIYGSDHYPVDCSKAENLLQTSVKGTTCALQQGMGKRFYAVTAMNRFGNESEAAQEAPRPQRRSEK